MNIRTTTIIENIPRGYTIQENGEYGMIIPIEGDVAVKIINGVLTEVNVNDYPNS